MKNYVYHFLNFEYVYIKYNAKRRYSILLLLLYLIMYFLSAWFMVSLEKDIPLKAVYF